MTHIIRDSGITVTDQFCGAGGSTIGAKRAGLIVLEAQNHWKRAIETYATNHQSTRVHHADVSNTDPRKLASTDLLITSPECTTHSPAGGNRKQVIPQRDMFAPDADDPRFERSRATMQDVIRYAEYHRYPCIIVENVVEVTKWELFKWWLNGMQLLGYDHRIVNLNSMFCWPTPQSRDRVYLVFWQRGNRAPNLEVTPLAHCARCEKNVAAVQTWKPKVIKRSADAGLQPIGKYRFQYFYSCPVCALEVTPYYYAALNAIDLSVAGEKIGTKKRPLMPRTRERIEYGLKKFGRRPLSVSTMHGERLASRVRDASARPMFTQSGAPQAGICTPFVVKLKGSDASHVTSAATSAADELPTLVASSKTAALVSHDAIRMIVNTRNITGTTHRLRDAHGEPLATQTAGKDFGLATSPPMLIETTHGADPHNDRVSDATAETMSTRTTKNGDAVILPPGFITTAGSNDTAPRQLHCDAIPTVTGTERLALVIGGAALISLRDTSSYWTGGADDVLRTQTGEQQAALTSLEGTPRIDYAADFVELPEQDINVDDCFFRMLLDTEIGRGMAFPDEYTVTGTIGERVKQYGNAVTPPAMDLLTRRCAASLAPELSE